MAPNESYPQHVVTAVLVAHDGTTWLNRVIDALLDQTRPVQRVVAVDTGSRDRSGAVLGAKLGQSVVFGMERSTGYGAAIAKALQHQAARVSIAASPGTSQRDHTEWIWLLHDDCEPAPDALEQLLRGAAEVRTAGVLGPKVRDWSARDVLLEAGLTIDTAGRRTTAIEPREVDQGQHDGDRDVLAVSSAGMLIRRDVWEQVGGFDESMALLMDDVDFCWRAHAAGFRVRLVTDAVVYHAQAATRRRRPVSVGRRVPMLNRRNSLLTLLGNLPAWPAIRASVGNLAVSLLRFTFFLLAKRPVAALDESAAVLAVAGHPVRFLRARRLRAPGRRAAYGRLRADLPPGRSVRKIIEFAVAATASSAQSGTAGSHHASTEDPSDDDAILVDSGLVQRLLASPVVWLASSLTVVALVAERRLLGPGPLAGGALIPAWGGASDLWHTFLQGFHPAGLGSASPAPPYVAILALLATVLGGKPWLAIDVIVLGCVPLAGVAAFLAARRVARSAPVRMWVAASYALLPVSLGVVAGGRFGSAVAFELLPLIGLLAGRMLAHSGRRARRAAWATGLVVTVAAMFAPLVWLLTLPAAALAALALRRTRPGMLTNLGIVVLVPPVLLLPWAPQLAAHPAQLVLEPGLQQPGTATAGLAARSLMLLSPGGPGLPPFWVTAGIALAGLAGLLATRRRRLILAGWGAAMAGLVAAIIVSRLTVTPASGGGSVTAWAGIPLAVAALGVLAAAGAGADALARSLSGRTRLRAAASPAGLWAALIALAACSAPVLAAAWWIMAGVSGPVSVATGPVVPDIVTITNGQGRELRTLALTEAGGHVSFALLRGPNPTLADASPLPSGQAQQALNLAVAALLAPGGGQAANQAGLLANFDIGFVLMRTPVNQRLATVLDNVAGLRPYSATAGYRLWAMQQLPWRVVVAQPGGGMVGVPSGPVSVTAKAPASGGTVQLAEPAGGWTATLNGRQLTPVPSPAGSWAQAFRLPAGGGSLRISHSQAGFDLLLALQALAFAIVAVLALPGARASGELLARSAGAQETSPEAAEGSAPSRAAGEEQQAGRRRARQPARVRSRRAAGPAGPERGGPDRARPDRSADKRGKRTAVQAGPPGPDVPGAWPQPDELLRDAAGLPAAEPATAQLPIAESAALEAGRFTADYSWPGTAGQPAAGLAGGTESRGSRHAGAGTAAGHGAAYRQVPERPGAGTETGWPDRTGPEGGPPGESRSGWSAGQDRSGWPDDEFSGRAAPSERAGRPAEPGRAGRPRADSQRGRAADGAAPGWPGRDAPQGWPDDEAPQGRAPDHGVAGRPDHDAAAPPAGWPGGGESLDPLPPAAYGGTPAGRAGRHGRHQAGRRSRRSGDRGQPFGTPDESSGTRDERFGTHDEGSGIPDEPFGTQDESFGSRGDPFDAADERYGNGRSAGAPEPPDPDPAARRRWPAPDRDHEGDPW